LFQGLVGTVSTDRTAHKCTVPLVKLSSSILERQVHIKEKT